MMIPFSFQLPPRARLVVDDGQVERGRRGSRGEVERAGASGVVTARGGVAAGDRIGN